MTSVQEKSMSEIKTATYGWGFRHVNALMLSLAMMLCYASRVVMSLAIVSMTDSANENYFDWSIQIQSTILSSFFWGYVVLLLPSGELAARFGGKILYTLCIGITAATLLLTPIAAIYGGWQLVCVCRVLQGLAQGAVFPATHHLIAKWVPVEEKARLASFIYAGVQVGMAGQLILGGYISEYWGWPAVFYVTGTLCAIWTVVYITIGSDSPYKSGLISDEERFYIQSSLGNVGEPKKYKTPWRMILTSVPFWACLITQVGQGWGYWTLMTEMPLFMNKILGVNIKKNGVMSAIPYIGGYVMSFPFGYISDLILRKHWLSLNASRKISNSIGTYGPAVALIAVSYVPAGNVALVVSLLTAALMLNSGRYAGYMLVHLDMAPNFAAQMMGFSAFFGNLSGIVAPLAAGALLKDETHPGDWQKVFYVSAAIYFVTNTVFVVFGTTDRQDWNVVAESKITDGQAQKRNA